jgi:hypothetical protein
MCRDWPRAYCKETYFVILSCLKIAYIFKGFRDLNTLMKQQGAPFVNATEEYSLQIVNIIRRK